MPVACCASCCPQPCAALRGADPAHLQAGNQEDVEKYSKRTVRVTREHNEECKRLLGLMGVPVVEAPSEAEAQCAQLCKEGLVRARGAGGQACMLARARACVGMCVRERACPHAYVVARLLHKACGLTGLAVRPLCGNWQRFQAALPPCAPPGVAHAIAHK